MLDGDGGGVLVSFSPSSKGREVKLVVKTASLGGEQASLDIDLRITLGRR